MPRLFLTIHYLLATSLLFTACAQSPRPAVGSTPAKPRKTTGAITPATYTGRQIMVGNGGGVTGLSTTYYLLDNGQLFGRRSRDTAFTPLGRQTAVNTKRTFTVAEDKCRILTTQFDNPGNRYKFVGWRKGKRTHKITWGEPGTTPPASYPKFYDSFMATIPKSTRLN